MKEIPPHEAPANAARDCYTVTEITEAIRQHLESEFPRVNIVGEVANCTVHTSGHIYFTLRDSDNVLSAALFRRSASRVAVLPENGMAVVAVGRISHFGGTGRTQIIVSELLPAGAGEMDRSFRALLERLHAEGLTGAERKRPIPPYPAKIAIVTSPTGAVIEDLLNTLGRRWPVASVVHVPTPVQGPAAAASIVSALARADNIADVDVIILARGGGSIEDLWTFNLESVARAVAGCRHPVITGIGHEIDTTICDYVSDLRAATPTAAAEIATPLIEEVRAGVRESIRKIRGAALADSANRRYLVNYVLRSAALSAIGHRMERSAYELEDREERIAGFWRQTSADLGGAISAAQAGLADSLERTLERAAAARRRASAAIAAANPRARVSERHETLRHIVRLLRWRVGSGIRERRTRLGGLSGELAGLSPRSVLKRGYAYCTTPSGARVIPRAGALATGDKMLVQFFDGGARCLVEGKRKGTPWRKK